MVNGNLQIVLNRLYSAGMPDKADIEFVLGLEDDAQIAELFAFADNVRKKYVGDEIFLRGIVEFSNECNNTCLYCGLNRNNRNLTRYSLDKKQILECIKH